MPRSRRSRLRATAIGTSPAQASTIELFRWSTDAERAPLLPALAAPAAGAASGVLPAGCRAAAAAAAGGRGGRGGRGGPPSPSPIARLTAAVKAAPTLGYHLEQTASPATRSSTRGGAVAAAAPSASCWSPIAGSAPRRSRAGRPHRRRPATQEFTVIEMRLDAKGMGEGKTSLTTNVVDRHGGATTLALDGYAAAPILLKVTR